MWQWMTHHPDIPITGPHPHAMPPESGPWIKARHVARITAGCRTPILIVSDVDVWTEPAAIRAAIDAVRAGHAWAVPHLDVHRLNQDATRTITAHPAPDGPIPIHDDARELERGRPVPQYPGHPGGGIVIIRTDVARDIPLDPRFVGWGQEDDSWALALTTLTGPPWRGRAPLIHLWHRPAPRLTRRHGNQAGINLHGRYRDASGSPDAMRAVLADIPTIH